MKINRIKEFFNTINSYILYINGSKLFAGLIIILLNISSKFVMIHLSPSIESYFKYTFNRNVLIFAISSIGTRDIYYALCIVFLFIILFDYLLNENSSMCILPEYFMDHHINLIKNNDMVTQEDLKKALEILEKAEKQTLKYMHLFKDKNNISNDDNINNNFISTQDMNLATKY